MGWELDGVGNSRNYFKSGDVHLNDSLTYIKSGDVKGDLFWRIWVVVCWVVLEGMVSCLGEDSVLEELDSWGGQFEHFETSPYVPSKNGMNVVWSSIPWESWNHGSIPLKGLMSIPYEQFTKIFPPCSLGFYTYVICRYCDDIPTTRIVPLHSCFNHDVHSKTFHGSDWIGITFFGRNNVSNTSRSKGTCVKHVQQPAPLVMIATPSSNVGNGWLNRENDGSVLKSPWLLVTYHNISQVSLLENIRWSNPPPGFLDLNRGCDRFCPK